MRQPVNPPPPAESAYLYRVTVRPDRGHLAVEVESEADDMQQEIDCCVAISQRVMRIMNRDVALQEAEMAKKTKRR